MQELTQVICNYLTKADANAIAVRERVEKAAATANNGKEPTVDCYGRLHAPCDGYMWEDEVYAGGSYLPFPAWYWEELFEQTGIARSGGSFNVTSKTRIKLLKSEADDITKLSGAYASFTCGKSWNSKDGEVCYMYIETNRKGLLTIIHDFKEQRDKELAEKLAAEKEAAKLLKGDAPEGRVVVKGKVLHAKLVERQSFGYYDNGYDWKMLVELENKSTVWGTIPSAINYGEDTVGREVQFTATFTPAEDDHTHAFFKRPAKAIELNEKGA